MYSSTISYSVQTALTRTTNIKTSHKEAGINLYVKLLMLCVDIKQMALPAFYMNFRTSVSCLQLIRSRERYKNLRILRICPLKEGSGESIGRADCIFQCQKWCHQQALHLWRAKRAARECASQRRSRMGRRSWNRLRRCNPLQDDWTDTTSIWDRFQLWELIMDHVSL